MDEFGQINQTGCGLKGRTTSFKRYDTSLVKCVPPCPRVTLMGVPTKNIQHPNKNSGEASKEKMKRRVKKSSRVSFI